MKIVCTGAMMLEQGRNRSVGNSTISPYPAVVSLFCRRSPSTVTGAVRAIIVDSVQRLSIRAVSHGLMEGFKRASPAIANINTTRPIIFIGAVVRVVAALVHGVPQVVFRQAAESVGAGAFAHGRTGRATAAGSQPRTPQCASHTFTCVAALTNAQPNNSNRAWGSNAANRHQHGKFPEYFPSYIERTFWKVYRMLFSHVDSPIIGKVRGRLLAQPVPNTIPQIGWVVI